MIRDRVVEVVVLQACEFYPFVSRGETVPYNIVGLSVVSALGA